MGVSPTTESMSEVELTFVSPWLWSMLFVCGAPDDNLVLQLSFWHLGNFVAIRASLVKLARLGKPYADRLLTLVIM